MRLAILSDIHSNLIALEAVLADLKASGGADQTWVLGDLCVLGPRPAECVKIIRGLPNTKVISGNVDRYLVTGERPTHPARDAEHWPTLATELWERERSIIWTLTQLSYNDYEFLRGLPHGVDLKIPGYGWVIGYHAAPGNDDVNMHPATPADEVLDHFIDMSGRLGFGGHTHIPMDRDLGAWRVVNVGSVGFPKGEPGACYMIATFENGTVTLDQRRVPFDEDAVLADLKAQGEPYTDYVVKFLKER